MPSQNPIAMMITRIIMTLGVKRKRRNSRNDGRLGITDGLWKSQLGQTSRSALQSQQHTSECGAQTICGNKLGINSFISCNMFSYDFFQLKVRKTHAPRTTPRAATQKPGLETSCAVDLCISQANAGLCWVSKQFFIRRCGSQAKNLTNQRLIKNFNQDYRSQKYKQIMLPLWISHCIPVLNWTILASPFLWKMKKSDTSPLHWQQSYFRMHSA